MPRKLEIIISHVDVQWKDSPVCYRLGGKLATHIGDVSFGGTDVSFLTLNHNLNATTMSLLLYSYYGTSRLPTRWRQNVTYYHQSFTDGRYISFHMWLWLGIELENSATKSTRKTQEIFTQRPSGLIDLVNFSSVEIYLTKPCAIGKDLTVFIKEIGVSQYIGNPACFIIL